MSNNLSKHTLGLTQLQSGQGVPTHQAKLGSLYINVSNADYYKNIDGLSNWTLITGTSGGTVTGGTIFQSGLTANTIYTDYIDFNTSAAQAVGIGRLIWNNTDGTLNLGLKGGNVTLQVGQEEVVRVVNGTGGSLLESQYRVVKIIGAQGQRLQVGLAQANNDANSKDTIGIVTENINNNQEGFVTRGGLVNEINTTGSLQGETWNDGDTLYLSPTTPGVLTNIKPIAPSHTVIVGFVVYSHAIHGKIFVKVDNGYELEELHNVQITGTTKGGSTLEYNTTNAIWVDAPITWTVELIEVLTVDVYAPYNLSIDTVTNVLNSPTITIYDDGVLYVLGNTITSGSKITILANTASVINLTINKL